MTTRIIKLVEIVGSDFCVSADDGKKVFEVIANAIKKEERVQVSFEGCEDLTSAFLNMAIGRLYGEFGELLLKSVLLPPVGASEGDLILLKRVVERAKDYYKRPERYGEVAKEFLGDD
jgi:hypothetical protein